MPEYRLRTFKTTAQADVPSGRHGKHREIVNHILNDLGGLESSVALKIPLDELPDSKVNIRSALSRATRKLGKSVATAADDEYLYVWNQ
ncbi:MAG: hypothetical protein ACRD3N_18535 [Terracidiphilus sp.]